MVFVSRIAIDQGHGGPDPGAIGPTGLKESMVTLPVGSLFYNVDQLALLLKTSSNTYLNLGEENTYIAKNGDGVTHLEGQVTM